MKRKYLKILGVLILSYSHAFTQMPTESLVAYYPFNGNANDSSGFGNNGIISGQVSVSGRCGSAYKFSGNFISCGDPANNQFDLIDDASISLWMKLYSAPPGGFPSFGSGYFTLIGKDVGPGSTRKWFLATNTNQLIFHINTSFSQGWAIQEVSTFVLDSFYHIVVTKTGNNYKFYVNGIYKGTQTVFLNIVDVPSPLRIGDLQDGSLPINATIDEVLIYNEAITEAKIIQLYNCNTGVVTSSSAIGADQTGYLKIYPNPSPGKFVLSVEDPLSIVKNLSVYNIAGEKIMGLHQVYFNQQKAIDLSMYPKGVYLLKMQIGKKIVSRKILIK